MGAKKLDHAKSKFGLDIHGISHEGSSFWNLGAKDLYKNALAEGNAALAHGDSLVVTTGKYTGRSPKDKFIVCDETTKEVVWWQGGNQSFSPEQFDSLHEKVLEYLGSQDLFIQDCFVGADPEYRVKLRVITHSAWHSLFARNMFIVPEVNQLAIHNPEFTVLHCPGFKADPNVDSTNSEAFIVINFNKKIVMIGGTEYAGEIKKSIFTVMNYILPEKDVFPMHCAANEEPQNGDVALFFGLSGTGKTTLSVTNDRILIGDDEHGWTPDSVFNFEGGCYAKVIRLSAEAEPEIFERTRSFGTVLENVVMDSSTGILDLDDESITENTRGSYPLSSLSNVSSTGCGKQPTYIFFLTADAFGVLPPLAKLTINQAMYYFISGYTAKLAGTERGVIKPEATFSTCFGAPFMPRHPSTYATLLGQRMLNDNVKAWLINTGWSGGPYGIGERVKISHTRSMIRAVLSGSMDTVSTYEDPIFRVDVPESCPDVPDGILRPRDTWPNSDGYDEQAKLLARMFQDNFSSFADQVSLEVLNSGPHA